MTERLMCEHLRDLIRNINRNFEVDISDTYGFQLTCKICNISVNCDINPSVWYIFNGKHQEYNNKIHKQLTSGKNRRKGMWKVIVPISIKNPFKQTKGS